MNLTRSICFNCILSYGFSDSGYDAVALSWALIRLASPSRVNPKQKQGSRMDGPVFDDQSIPVFQTVTETVT